MEKPRQPLAEVFGYTISDQTEEAIRHRSKRLCPFGNKVPNCTKDKANNPLGACSLFYAGSPAIICPIRFRENWIITDAAASFFFGELTAWTSLMEVRLKDKNGKSAGNIDVVLVSYDDYGKVLDFGALEIQAVYISGNVREPFEYFMQDPQGRANMTWNHQHYPRPDYLSSSRKRLAPQLIFKGGILYSWKKKIAVALNREFYNTLPKLEPVPKEQADIAWLIYDLVETRKDDQTRYTLQKAEEIFTEFQPALDLITTPFPGNVEDFLKQLQRKLDEQLEPTLNDNKTIGAPFQS